MTTPKQRRVCAPLAALGIMDLDEAVDQTLVELLEAEWQEQFLEMAHMLGYDHNFTRRTRGRGNAWVTSTSKSGWPDMFVWSEQRGRSMFVELKREAGNVDEDQVDVLCSLHRAGLEVHVWRPRHLQIAQLTLTRRN